MANFDKGVDYYTHGTATITVHFPEDEVKCKWCPFCRAESDLSRYWCRLTNSMIYNPNIPGLPEGCPIKITKEES